MNDTNKLHEAVEADLDGVDVEQPEGRRDEREVDRVRRDPALPR